MMKQIKLLMLCTLVIAISALLVVNVKAQEFPHNPYVWVTDQDGNIREEFNLDETIVIHAYCLKPYMVSLWDPDDICVWTESSTGGLNEWTLAGEIATNKLGCWTIRLNQYDCKKYAVGMYNVIPEVSFGVLGTLAACFTGLGLKSLRAKRKV